MWCYPDDHSLDNGADAQEQIGWEGNKIKELTFICIISADQNNV